MDRTRKYDYVLLLDVLCIHIAWDVDLLLKQLKLCVIMKKVDFIYVELGIQGFAKIGHIVKVDEVEKFVDVTDIDRCKTWCTFSKDIIPYTKNNLNRYRNPSTAKYKGFVCCDFIPIDIDDLDPSKVEEVVEILNGYGVLTECLSFYFSGKKGFHIEIPSDIVGIDPLPVEEFYDRIIKFLNVLGINSDPKMNSRLQHYRLTNTMNGKSNLYKIPIKFSEIHDDLYELAKSPRFETFATKVTELNDTLNGIWLETAQSLKTPMTTKDSLKKNNSWILGSDQRRNSLKTRPGEATEGFRNSMGSEITRKLMMKGFKMDNAKKKLVEWNKELVSPLDTSELMKLFKSNWSYGIDFKLFQTKQFRANLREDIIFQDYLRREDKDYLAVYVYLLLNLNDEDKEFEFSWGESIIIKQDQIMIGYKTLAEKLNLKSKYDKVNKSKVRTVVNDLVEKGRFIKEVIGIIPIQKRIILTWNHFSFTQTSDTSPSREELVEECAQ